MPNTRKEENEMKAQQQVFEFIKESMGHSTLLAISGELVPFANDSFDNARFISQLLFWVDDRNEWTPIAYKEWKSVAKMSRYAVEKARNFFYNLGVLEYKVKKDSSGNPTAHYRLDFKALMKALTKFFKTAKKVIMTGFADLLKSKRGQDQNQSFKKTYPLSKEMFKTESISQQSKTEIDKTKKGFLKDKYESYYL